MALLQKLVLNKGDIFTLLKQFEETKLFGENQKARQSLEDLRMLGENLKIFGCYDYISFDCSLARGLDYYTGLIFEAVLLEENNLGSIGGGGRYDGLIGMFSKSEIPSIGMSIGIERLFVILEQKRAKGCRESDTEILVASIGKDMMGERMKMLKTLWDNGFKAESLYDASPKPDKQLKKALSDRIPVIIWIGENELKSQQVNVKMVNENKEEAVKLEALVEFLKKYFRGE